ncbi:MAG: hypothetical protein ACK4GN_04220, partial [Runella sp.]
MKKLCTSVSSCILIIMLLLESCQNDKMIVPNATEFGLQATYLQFETPEEFKQALIETSKLTRKELDDWDSSKGFISLCSIYEQIVDEENEAYRYEENLIQKNPSLAMTLKHKNSNKIDEIKSMLKIDNSGIELNLYDSEYANLLNKNGIVKIGKSIVRFGPNHVKVILDGDEAQFYKLLAINEKNQTPNLRYFPVHIFSKEIISNARQKNNNRYCYHNTGNYEMQAWSDGYYSWYYIVGYGITTVSTVAAKIEMRLRRKGWTGIWVNHNTTSYSVDGTWGFSHNLSNIWPGLPLSPHGPNTITLGSGFDGHTSNPKYYFYFNEQYNLNNSS